jgi:DNA-binding NarL/FixJ family response regulator
MLSGGRITLVLADGRRLVRRRVRRILEEDRRLLVVGEASSDKTAIRLARSLKPSVILMSCALPGMGAVAATREIARALPRTAVVLLARQADEWILQQALEAGASGHALSVLDFDFVGVIRRAATGGVVGEPQPNGTRESGRRLHALTPRELEVLRLICAGRSNRQIAATLHLSANTVAVHRANMMNSLGLHKTAELVTYAIRHGLVAVS